LKQSAFLLFLKQNFKKFNRSMEQNKYSPNSIGQLDVKVHPIDEERAKVTWKETILAEKIVNISELPDIRFIKNSSGHLVA
jgi:hypothetical protein